VQKSKHCPLCQAEWTGNNFVGERAVTTTEKYMQGKRRSGGVTDAERNPALAVEESENEADEQG